MGLRVTTLGNQNLIFARRVWRTVCRLPPSQEPLPQICHRQKFLSGDEQGKLRQDLRSARQAITDYGVNPYTILDRQRLQNRRIWFDGYKARSNAPMPGDLVDRWKGTADHHQLIQQEKVI
jgi:hypothetical protein